MDTFFARNRLSAYLDGNLNTNEAAEVEAALAEDPALRHDYDAMRSAVEMLRTLGPVQAPEGFQARVLARVQDEPDPGVVVSLWRRSLGRLPVEALALAAAAVLVVMVIQGKDSAPPDDPLALQRTGQTQDYDASSSANEDAASASAPAPSPTRETQQGPQSAQAKLKDTPNTHQTQGGSAAQALPPAADGDLRTTARSSGDSSGDASGDISSASGSTDRLDKRLKSLGDTPSQPYAPAWETTVPGADLDGTASAPRTQSAQDLAERANTGDAGLSTTRGNELSTGIDMEGPRSYRISMATDKVLAQLSAVAAQTGGRLTTASGAPLKTLSLGDNGKTTWVHIVVPQDRATDVEGYLNGLSAVPTPPPTTDVLYGSDFTVFVIQLTGTP